MKYGIFIALLLISGRAYFAISHGDKTWILWLPIAFFLGYLSYASYTADLDKQKIYVIQILGFIGLSIVLFLGSSIPSQVHNFIIIAYMLIFVSFLIGYGAIGIVMRKFRDKTDLD